MNEFEEYNFQEFVLFDKVTWSRNDDFGGFDEVMQDFYQNTT